MTFRCPTCDSVLHNRRRVTCEFCGAIIPAGDRLTAAQRTAIDLLEKIERQEPAASMNRDLPPFQKVPTQELPSGC